MTSSPIDPVARLGAGVTLLAISLLSVTAAAAPEVERSAANQQAVEPSPTPPGAAEGAPQIAPSPGTADADAPEADPEAPVDPEPDVETEAQITPESDIALGFTFTGDFRLRYEQTTKQKPGSRGLTEARHRGVARFRAGATRQLAEPLTFGVRIATGSADDPNSTDVTLGSFVNDLEVSLDRVYLEWAYRDVFLTGGKFPNPFLRRTDLLWDDDVNPQGVGGSYTLPGIGSVTPKVTGLFAIVDEHTVDPDSYMWGSQLELAVQPPGDWDLSVAGAYYDYTIKSLSNAEAGDTRSNFLSADGLSYLSDFNLLDVIAVVEHTGSGNGLPLRLVANYVKNLGSAVAGEDDGLSVDVYAGRASSHHDLRLRYGYSFAGTDAVLAAFSNDNTTLATNYEQHTVSVDYIVYANTLLNATWYLYRPHRLFPGQPLDAADFVSRLRLNLMVGF